MLDKNVLLVENYKHKQIKYQEDTGSNKLLISSINDNSTSSNFIENVKIIFQEIFLPQGYPHSVSPDYKNYQIWDTIQAFCSTITGILSTHAVMKGVGVGDTNATPLAATFTWVLKDGTGHIGRILFAWWKGTSLDADSKKWRLFADILNDCAICLEVALPLFYGYTTYVLCLSTAMKSIVGVAGGATRAALTQHQAIRGNLADVAAKDGSQETAVNLIASFVAVFILSFIGQNIWPVFFLFTFLHLFSNYNAVSSVCLNTFNSSRFIDCLRDYISTGVVLGPKEVNETESVFLSRNKMNASSLCGYEVKLGSSLKSNKLRMINLKTAVDVHTNEKYLLTFDIADKYVYIVLQDGATSNDILMSYYHAVIFAIILSDINDHKLIMSNSLNQNSILLQCKSLSDKYKKDLCTNEVIYPSTQLYEEVGKIVKDSWKRFKQKASDLGWNFDNHLLICDEWRANWKTKQQ